MLEQSYTTNKKASNHDTLMPLLEAMYNEFKEISKKKPDSAVSPSKIKIANRLLETIRTILKDEESIDFLDMLEEDDVPQVSDVALILSQYVAAMKAFHSKNFGWSGSNNEWFIK